MSYFLNAILSRSQLQPKSKLTSLKHVNLEQDLVLIPVTDSLFDEIAASATQGHDLVQGFEKLSTTLVEWLREVSEQTLVAYVEAEFWGGIGAQSAVMWEKREVVFQSMNSQDAINQVLQLFGIKVKGAIDEFAAVNLGRNRFTDHW